MPRGHPSFELFVQKLALRSILTEDERQAILTLNGREREVEPHRDIVAPGQITDTACFVVSGMAARFGQLRDGRRQITAIHLPGDMCDLYSLMLPRVEWALQALSLRLTIVQVPHKQLAALVRDHPGIGEAFWRDCVADASILSQWVVNVGRRDARMRTAHLLCELGVRMEASGLGSRTRFRLAAVQSQLADALGMTPVHMNRVFRTLRNEGLAQMDGRDVTIADWNALAAVGGFDEGYLELNRHTRLI